MKVVIGDVVSRVRERQIETERRKGRGRERKGTLSVQQRFTAKLWIIKAYLNTC